MRLLLVPDPASPYGQDAFCREIAERNQMDSLTLNVRTENQTAKAVCLKRGFRHVADGEIWSLTP